MTSSHYGPYGLGYTCATKIMTERCKCVSMSKSKKVIVSTDCTAVTRGHEVGIASNRIEE